MELARSALAKQKGLKSKREGAIRGGSGGSKRSAHGGDQPKIKRKKTVPAETEEAEHVEHAEELAIDDEQPSADDAEDGSALPGAVA